jgi:hypothetical protein
MKKSFNSYNNLGYWFLLLLVLIPLGFYKSYFSVLLEPKSSIVHIHFVLMSLWIAMLIIQPFLIKYKKIALHRLIGKVSYVILPLLLIAAWLMIRDSYYHFIAGAKDQYLQGLSQLTDDQVLQNAAAYETIAFIYFVWLAVFYLLGILNRRTTAAHSRFMMAAGLAMTGPAVDRIFINVFGIESFPGGLPVETFSFIIVDAILVMLLIRDYRNKKPVKTLWICLVVYLLCQLLDFAVPGTSIWKNIVAFLMKPVP